MAPDSKCWFDRIWGGVDQVWPFCGLILERRRPKPDKGTSWRTIGQLRKRLRTPRVRASLRLSWVYCLRKSCFRRSRPEPAELAEFGQTPGSRTLQRSCRSQSMDRRHGRETPALSADPVDFLQPRGQTPAMSTPGGYACGARAPTRKGGLQKFAAGTGLKLGVGGLPAPPLVSAGWSRGWGSGAGPGSARPVSGGLKFRGGVVQLGASIGLRANTATTESDFESRCSAPGRRSLRRRRQKLAPRGARAKT